MGRQKVRCGECSVGSWGVIRYANKSTVSLGRNDLRICRHGEGRKIKQRWSRKCWR